MGCQPVNGQYNFDLAEVCCFQGQVSKLSSHRLTTFMYRSNSRLTPSILVENTEMLTSGTPIS